MLSIETQYFNLTSPAGMVQTEQKAAPGQMRYRKCRWGGQDIAMSVLTCGADTEVYYCNCFHEREVGLDWK